jgi:hypothetical protein
MVAPIFTKFDPRAFLEGEARSGIRAEVAKAAKPPREQEVERKSTLASLAALAGGRTETGTIEPATDTWTEAEEERAAIIEHDGGVPRDWAEGFTRLDRTKPPGEVSPQRWLRFIGDCGRFLNGGWAARAAILGWGPLHLFGCDRKRPFARLDHRGLLWEINGGRLIELHRDRAIIETASGARQSYRRQPLEVGRVVLAWELE